MRLALRVMALLFAGACASVPARLCAQTTTRPPTTDVLRDLNSAIEQLTRKVSPSVVQVLVTGYRSVDEPNRGDAGLVIGRQRSVGSGAIIDSGGYIVTNAHVVSGAQTVSVVLHGPVADTGPLQALAFDSGKTLPARIVGVAPDIDLALLKIDATGLPALVFADYDQVQQGELVFAFGSPIGLRNSVTMGVVSAVARQLDPDSPSVYVQTDAPINPGNSGGPLVNVDGQIVGLNTFIMSQSGGSQGLGFAIPSEAVSAAYPQLRTYGHLHRGVIGISVQAITPTLANGLRLPRTAGVMVSDIVPDSPADIAGVQIQDVIAAVNGRPVDSVPSLTLALSTRKAGDTVILALVRDSQTVSISVPVIERPNEIDRFSDLGNTDANSIPKLGIVGVDVSDDIKALVPDLRIASGVLVTARRLDSDADVPLMAGDVIHAVNSFTVRSMDGLRLFIDGIKSGSDIVLRIERDRRLMFVVMTIN